MTEDEMFERMSKGEMFSPPNLNDEDCATWLRLTIRGIRDIGEQVREIMEVDDRNEARAMGQESHFMTAADAWARVMIMAHNVEGLLRMRFLNSAEMHEVERRKAEIQLGQPVKAVHFGVIPGFMQVELDDDVPDKLPEGFGGE